MSMGVGVALGGGTGCDQAKKLNGYYGPTPLEKLVLNLDSKYIRTFEKDDFSLHYRSRSPDVVLIEVVYDDNTKKDHMRKVVAAAKEQVIGMGADLYNLRGIRVVINYEQKSASSVPSDL